uniref:Retrotransposon protein, putative, Ty1-copia sub-class n=2 Tax=Oryza sativa subsp. japonica TaxID=39947 RepID=Q2R5N8_ORYSJ|nr:retrotransposon protein, putative, Ty1-copia sub-class [Oryza sativa Japonica Group]AAX96512.1 retrotransposon protein, putative, Ty1-copia sub-class [Oryza sativa Japonica Group]ABA93276.1 retrotransposon protein, putative, Ty1-copia subclass [Oryza sativa Japonica Group]
MAVKDRFTGNPGRLTVLTTSGSGCFTAFNYCFEMPALCKRTPSFLWLYPASYLLFRVEVLLSWSRLREVGFVAAVKLPYLVSSPDLTIRHERRVEVEPGRFERNRETRGRRSNDTFMLVYIFNVMIYLWNKLNHYVLINSTIQKPYYRHCGFTMIGFADALKPDKFTGVHFKRWQIRVTLWLIAMKCFWLSTGKTMGVLTADQQKEFDEATTLFVGCILNVLGDRLVDVYMHMTDAKELWDALNTKFGATDVSNDLHLAKKCPQRKGMKAPVGQTSKFANVTIGNTGKGSGFCYVYMLKMKDEGLDYFKIYKAEVENQLDREIKRFRSDRGGELFLNEFDLFYEEHGIIHKRTHPYFPESNGIAERKNRTLIDLVNAMLHTAELLKAWWREALLTSNHVLNRVPNRNKNKTPDEIWIGRKPSLSYLCTRGCLAKVNVPITKKRKLRPKTVDSVFLGYAHHSTAYRFLIVKSESISEAYASPDADYWKEVVRSEMDSIIANGTWEVTERPYGCRPMGCNWVFKKKFTPDGTIEKYKAQLVEKGYTQKEGEDFFDTYSLIARLTTIRVKKASFDMKKLGVADVILNIRKSRGENGITLLQSHYVEKILNRFGYIDSKPSPTLYDPSLLLRKNKRIARNQLEYSQIIEHKSILERTHLCELDCWSQSTEILDESSRKLTKRPRSMTYTLQMRGSLQTV